MILRSLFALIFAIFISTSLCFSMEEELEHLSKKHTRRYNRLFFDAEEKGIPFDTNRFVQQCEAEIQRVHQYYEDKSNHLHNLYQTILVPSEEIIKEPLCSVSLQCTETTPFDVQSGNHMTINQKFSIFDGDPNLSGTQEIGSIGLSWHYKHKKHRDSFINVTDYPDYTPWGKAYQIGLHILLGYVCDKRLQEYFSQIRIQYLPDDWWECSQHKYKYKIFEFFYRFGFTERVGYWDSDTLFFTRHQSYHKEKLMKAFEEEKLRKETHSGRR